MDDFVVVVEEEAVDTESDDLCFLYCSNSFSYLPTNRWSLDTSTKSLTVLS